MAVYRRQLPDVVPVGIYSKQFPRGYDERAFRSLGLGIVDYYPVTSMIGPPYRMGPGFLSEIKDAEFRVQHTWKDGHAYEIRTYETRVGTLSQHVRKDPFYNSDWTVKEYIETPEDYKVMQFLVENSVIRSNARQIRQRMGEIGADGVVLGRIDRSPFQKMIIEFASPETFLVDIMSDLPEAVELLEVMLRKYDDILAQIGDSPVEVIWQTENLSGDLTTPAFFAKYCLPLYERAVTFFDQSVKPYVVHTDGRMKPLLELIGRCPFAICESFSYQEMGNDATFAEARQAWPGKVIIPNWPASLSYASSADITAWLAGKLAEAGLDQPYMIQFSEDVPPDQFSKTARAVLHCVAQHGRIRAV